jgi:hypothetical protein
LFGHRVARTCTRIRISVKSHPSRRSAAARSGDRCRPSQPPRRGDREFEDVFADAGDADTLGERSRQLAATIAVSAASSFRRSPRQQCAVGFEYARSGSGFGGFLPGCGSFSQRRMAMAEVTRVEHHPGHRRERARPHHHLEARHWAAGSVALIALFMLFTLASTSSR